MRVRTTMMVMCLLMATAPAFSASQKDHDDCNSENAERNIAGCTRIINDSTESEKVRGIAHVGRGIAWQGKGERDKALADFTDAIRLNPNDSLAYSNRGIIWREKHEVDRAIADFTEAIRIDPKPRSDLAGSGHVNIYTNRGLAWEAKGDLDRALADFDQAIGQDANDTQIYYLRGLARYNQYMFASAWIRKDDLDRAIADFTQVVRLDPTMAIAHYVRGLAHNISGDRDRAIADLMEAARLDPINPGIRAALKQLKPDYEPPKDSLEKLLKWAPLQTKAR